MTEINVDKSSSTNDVFREGNTTERTQTKTNAEPCKTQLPWNQRRRVSSTAIIGQTILIVCFLPILPTLNSNLDTTLAKKSSVLNTLTQKQVISNARVLQQIHPDQRTLPNQRVGKKCSHVINIFATNPTHTTQSGIQEPQCVSPVTRKTSWDQCRATSHK